MLTTDDLPLIRQTLATWKRVDSDRLDVWLADPVRWAIDCIPDIDLTEYQEEELTRLATDRRVAVRGPRGSGKTMPAAVAFWWFVCTREMMGVDWKAPTTSGSWLQVRRYLWPEIHKWHNKINWGEMGLPRPRPGVDLLRFSLTMEHGEGFGAATDDPALIEGAHASHMLVIIDEGKSVVDGIWDAVEGFFFGPGEYYLFALSTPGAPVGRFADIHHRKPGYEDWTAIHVTKDRAVKAGRLTKDTVAQRAAQWGEESQLFRTHILAEFAGEEDGVIPLAWIEAAIERGRDIDLSEMRPHRVGVDVSDTGEDQSVLAWRDGWHLYRVDKYAAEGDVLLLGERVINRLAKGGVAVIDAIGVGAGTYKTVDRAKGVTALPFVASAGTKRRDSSGEIKFSNKRAAAWWNLRELLHPDTGEPISLPDDPELLGDLTAPKWREVAGGKILVESKDDIRKRLGRSTDVGDAVVMAFWEEASARKLTGIDLTSDLGKAPGVPG